PPEYTPFPYTTLFRSYGRDGVAVRTTVSKLKLALKASGRDFAFGKMTYVEALPRLALGFHPEDPKHRQLLLMPHFLKRKEYVSEDRKSTRLNSSHQII